MYCIPSSMDMDDNIFQLFFILFAFLELGQLLMVQDPDWYTILLFAKYIDILIVRFYGDVDKAIGSDLLET